MLTNFRDTASSSFTRARAGALAALAAAGVLVVGAAAPAAPAGHAAGHAAGQGLPSDQVISHQFALWSAALATGDPEAVADRYAPDAVLVPTLSNDIRTDRAGIVDYFEDFLAKHPSGEITESHVHVLDHDDAIDTGAYRFHLIDEEGEPYTVDARYTFVYELDHETGEWLIINHHSSAMPEDD
jgi:uncharacterized protein (TIGR02246 family)